MRNLLTLLAVGLFVGGCSLPQYMAVTRLSGETSNPLTDTQLERCSVACRGECDGLDLVELCALVQLP